MEPNQPTLMTLKIRDHQTNPKNRHALFSHRGNRQSIEELHKNIIRKKNVKSVLLIVGNGEMTPTKCIPNCYPNSTKSLDRIAVNE